MNEPCDLRISGSIPAPLHLIFSRFGSSLGSFQSSKKKKRNKNHWVLGDFQTCPAHHNRMLIQGAPTDKCERSSTSTQGLKQPSTRPPSLCRCTGPVPFFPKSFTQIPPCNLSAPTPTNPVLLRAGIDLHCERRGGCRGVIKVLHPRRTLDHRRRPAKKTSGTHRGCSRSRRNLAF